MADNQTRVLQGAFLFCVMKEIILTRGYTTIVDDDVFKWASNYRWTTLVTKYGTYAVRKTKIDGKIKSILMHREIMGIEERFIQVDHRNRYGLDNQKHNLRVCTPSQNTSNRCVQSNNKSGYKGVRLHRNGRYEATIGIRKTKKTKHLGYFKTAIEAAVVYDCACIHDFGEFANPNFACSRLLTLSQIL